MIDAFRKHAGEKQCIVANVLSHLALAVKRGRWTIDRIGLQQHLADVS